MVGVGDGDADPFSSHMGPDHPASHPSHRVPLAWNRQLQAALTQVPRLLHRTLWESMQVKLPVVYHTSVAATEFSKRPPSTTKLPLNTSTRGWVRTAHGDSLAPRQMMPSNHCTALE